MKPRLFFLSALCPVVLLGSEISALTFPEKRIELLPPLSLADVARVKPLETMTEARKFFYPPNPQPLPRANSRSQMPILVPKDDVNWHLRILAPDPTVDYKLIVKDPSPAPAR